ncbi:hypothetical protein GCM10029978_065850 [Actinoallomurus acanthiterrae]
MVSDVASRSGWPRPVVIAGPDGAIVWVSEPLPGAVHDLKAARLWGIIGELKRAGLIVLACKG